MREQSKLQERGVNDKTFQNYLAWRRSVLGFVILCTTVAAGLSTYHAWMDTSDRPDILASLESHLADSMLAHDSEIASTMEQHSERIPIDAQDEEGETSTVLGKLVEVTQWLSWYILPLAAIGAMFGWTRFQFTHRLMLSAFAFSFLLPMFVALLPWSWTYIDPSSSSTSLEEKRMESLAYGISYGAEYMITLLPTVLSLVPGVQRACLRIKTMLPQSILPGWFLVAAAPFYSLVMLVVFVAVNQVADGPFFFTGMMLMLVAPLIYCVRADLVTQPLTTKQRFQSLKRLQTVVGLTTVMAGILILIFVLGVEVQGVRLVGIEPKSSLLQPMEACQLILETLGKSMFITVLGADLLIRMNVKAWLDIQSFVGTSEERRYTQAMGAWTEYISSKNVPAG